MSQEDVSVLSLEDSDSERFQTAEAGSSADEVDACLSVVWEVEELAVAEAKGPKTSERPAPDRQASTSSADEPASAVWKRSLSLSSSDSTDTSS
jgi:hypothetical protein